MTNERRGLGRGLAALLGEDEAVAEDGGTPARSAQTLPVELIEPGRFQPRRIFDEDELTALALSIREKGLLQPILVRPHAHDYGRYEIIAGERRWRAAQKAGMHEIPALVRPLSDRDALEVALVENIQREDLSPLEEAEGYQRLLEEFDHTQEALAQVLGRSRSHIANMIRLLSLPAPVKKMVDDGSLSAGHARAILSVADPADLARQIVRRQLSVRQTERLVQATRERPRPRKTAPAKSTDVLALERELGAALGLKIEINDRNGNGTVQIEYRTLAQLDDIIRRLKKSLA